MPIAYFQSIQMLNFKYTIGRRNSKSGAKEIAVEFRKVVIAGIIWVINSVHHVRCKIIDSALLIKSIERGDGKKRCEFDHRFYLQSI